MLSQIIYVLWKKLLMNIQIRHGMIITIWIEYKLIKHGILPLAILFMLV